MTYIYDKSQKTATSVTAHKNYLAESSLADIYKEQELNDVKEAKEHIIFPFGNEIPLIRHRGFQLSSHTHRNRFNTRRQILLSNDNALLHNRNIDLIKNNTSITCKQHQVKARHSLIALT